MNFLHYNSPFARFIMRLVDIVVLSILTMICCIPLISIGAAFSALYYVLLKMVRNNEGSIVRTYFKGFKDNFKQGTILWIFLLSVILVLVLDFYLLSNISMDYSDLVRILLLILSAFLLMVGNYVFPMQAQFENTVFGTLKKSFFVCVMNLPRSGLLLLIMLCPVVIIFFFPETIYFLPVLSIAAVPYLKTEILTHIFEQYMPKEGVDESSGAQE